MFEQLQVGSLCMWLIHLSRAQDHVHTLQICAQSVTLWSLYTFFAAPNLFCEFVFSSTSGESAFPGMCSQGHREHEST
jgi:hypothetical protein